VAHLPGIAGVEPLELWRLANRLNTCFVTRSDSELLTYLDTYEDLDCLWERGEWISLGSTAFKGNTYERDDLQEITALFEKEWGRLERERPRVREIWKACDSVTRTYLLLRVCDLLRFGEEVASVTFPHPGREEYEYMVSAIMWLYQDKQERIAREAQEKRKAEECSRIKQDCMQKIMSVSLPMPATIVERKLTATERGDVLRACEREFSESEPVKAVIEVVRQFAEFCTLLSRPENQIKVPTGQYIEREVNARTEQDMVNEMARELISLPKFTAWAKMRQERDGVQVIWKGKIKTTKLDTLPSGEFADAAAKTAYTSIERNSLRFLRERELIEQEIQARQEGWRRAVPIGETGGREDNKSQASLPSRIRESDDPPPPYSQL
jgi:hypothetical protein